MNTTEGLLAAGGGAVAGAVIARLVTPSPLDRSVFATTDGDELKRVTDILTNAGVANKFTSPGPYRLGKDLTRLLGKTPFLWIILVAEKDLDKVRDLMPLPAPSGGSSPSPAPSGPDWI